MLIAAGAAAIVFFIWYSRPWGQMLGVGAIFATVVGVDVVCGPLLTLLLAHPRKPARTLYVDISLVAVIQMVALSYGLWTMFAARPVVVAFEVDRFVVVTANEVIASELDEAPPDLRTLSWMGARYVATRSPRTDYEHLKSIELSMSGVTTAMRPGWWRPYEEASSGMARAARPLSELLKKRVEQQTTLKDAAVRSGVSVADLRYLPLTSSRQSDWVMLLDASGKAVGHAHVDGFD